MRELIELRPRELQVEVLRAFGGRGHEGQVDLRRHRRRQLDLRLLRGLVQPLQRHLVRAQVDALVLLELGQEPLNDALVEVVAAQVGVAVGRLDLEDALAELEDRDVERSAAEVIHYDLFVLLFIEAVGKCCGGRFVQDAANFEEVRCRLGRYIAVNFKTGGAMAQTVIEHLEEPVIDEPDDLDESASKMEEKK